VASSSSSTKKAARLAQKGGGQKVRFQGGTLFPLIVAVVCVLGLGSIAYARQSRPAADSSPPTVNDHWHAAYGFNLCGEWLQLNGNLEEQGTAGFQRFVASGVHSHDDGVIHWHPYTSKAVGARATLGVFLDSYDVKITNDELIFPADQLGGAEYIEGETKCDGQDAEVSVIRWNNYTDTDSGDRFISNMDEVHIDNDQMVFTIAFVPRGDDVGKPPWAGDLPELGQADVNQASADELLGGTGSTDGQVILGEPKPDDTTGDTTTDTTDSGAVTDTTGG
jgi:hypothetical protein